MKLDRKTLEELAERKIEHKIFEKDTELESNEGSRLDHWVEGCETGKSNELTRVLRILGVYDEVLKIVLLMEDGNYWTQEEVDKAHDEAIDYWHEKLSEEWDDYCADGGRLDFEDWSVGR